MMVREERMAFNVLRSGLFFQIFYRSELVCISTESLSSNLQISYYVPGPVLGGEARVVNKTLRR